MKKLMLLLLASGVLMAQQSMSSEDINRTVQEVLNNSQSTVVKEEPKPKKEYLVRYDVLGSALGVHSLEIDKRISDHVALGINTDFGSQEKRSYDMGIFSVGARAYFYKNGTFNGDYFSVRVSYDTTTLTSGSTNITGGGVTYGAVWGYMYDFELFQISADAGYGLGEYTFTDGNSELKISAIGILIGLHANVAF